MRTFLIIIAALIGMNFITESPVLSAIAGYTLLSTIIAICVILTVKIARSGK